MAIWRLCMTSICEPDWREGHGEPRLWDQASYIPDAELWEAHRRRKRRLIASCGSV